MSRIIYQFSILVVVLTLTGCGGSSHDVNTVTGMITLDGTPFPSARVTFSPQNGRPSYGITDESGRYQLRYLRDVMGAVPGQHTVAIVTEAETLPDGQQPPEKIPAKYNTATTLTAEVKQGPNEIDFALESKKK